MKRIAEVELIGKARGGRQAKVYKDQEVEIHHEADTILQAVDGRISTSHHPSKIFWLGGKAESLKGIKAVRITAHSGVVLVDGELNRAFSGPQNIAGGVAFSVQRA